MKKFLLSLAAVAFTATALMAQAPVIPSTPVTEEPDRVQMKALSKNPTGMDIPTGYDRPQAVADKKHECKGHKDGQACNKPADKQCPDCKKKAAAGKQCEKAAGKQCEKAAGKQCEKAAGKQCEKAAGKQCEKAAGKQCEKAAGKQCEKAGKMKHEQCKGHKDGQACNKPADKQCPDCKKKAAEGKKKN